MPYSQMTKRAGANSGVADHPTPRTRGHLAAVFAALSIASAWLGATPGAWLRHDLGAFWMQAPPGWTYSKGTGTDSAVGRLHSAGVSMDVDFGLYSDPLQIPEGAAYVKEQALTVDGLPARQVSYVMYPAAAPPVHYLGLHVPVVRTTSMGKKKLTLLAQSADALPLKQAAAVMATIRFKPAPRH